MAKRKKSSYQGTRMLTPKPITEAELGYHIVVYDNGVVEEESNLDARHSELRDSCREEARYFQKNYKGRFELKISIN